MMIIPIGLVITGIVTVHRVSKTIKEMEMK